MSTTPKKQAAPKKPANIEAFLGLPDKITELIAKESDRGTILIITAYLEEILGLLISTSTVSEDDAKPLLSLSGPCGNFEAKILIAKAFGLIHEDDVKPLRLIQQIRNKAAHFDRTQGRGFDVLFDAPGTIEKVVALAKLFQTEVTNTDTAEIKSAFVKCSRMLTSRLCILVALAHEALPCQSPSNLTAQILADATENKELFAKLLGHIFKESKDGKIDIAGQMQKLFNVSKRKAGASDPLLQRNEMMMQEGIAMLRANIGDI